VMRVHPVALGLRGCVWGRLYGGQSKSHWMQWDGGRGDERTAGNGKAHVLLDLFKYVGPKDERLPAPAAPGPVQHAGVEGA
jgi:hypothetical protein